MNDTRITLVGTALTAPERRVIERSGAVVANFRVISNARWKSKDGSWIDGSNFRCRVVCWRRMADHVFASVRAGDPVIVHGRISTKEWKTETGEPRIAYEIDAEAVGHDLHRGISVFTRMRHESPNSVVEDDESENRIDGELAHAYAPPGAEADEEFGHGYDESFSSMPPETAEDALAMLRTAGLGDPGDTEDDGTDDGEDEELVGASAGRGRRRGR